MIAGCRSLQDEGVNDIAIETFSDAEAAAEGAYLGTWKFQEFKTKAATKASTKIQNYDNKNKLDFIFEKNFTSFTNLRSIY